ncbi:MAG: hypothetical protein RMM28_05695 [Thermoleophilia bacterium]|nr:hypothetical protein [Gaiellaceae bacterium]MDW8338612.1 hypothetical protein [Thermoleophilia bacterium]
MGALLAERDDEWQVVRPSRSAESIEKALADPPVDASQAARNRP